MSKDQPAKKPRRDKAAIAEAATLIEPNRALLEKWNAGKYGLRDFTNLLVEIARDSVSDPRLVEKEPTKLHRHSEILSHTVTELERFGVSPFRNSIGTHCGRRWAPPASLQAIWQIILFWHARRPSAVWQGHWRDRGTSMKPLLLRWNPFFKNI